MLWAAPAAARTPEEVARRIAEESGATVLRIERMEWHGRTVYQLTVMLPPDAGNAAFQIGTLWIDAETGQLVPRLVHRPDGWIAPPPPISAPEPAGSVVRRESLEREPLR
jgi:hypothetical protein